MRRDLAFVLALIAPLGASASKPGDPLTAVRTRESIHVDGRLDEPAWELAPSFDGFIDRYPDEGAPPSQRTEVKVLYDDRALYIGFVCHDTDPSRIDRTLGRRDKPPYTDFVMFAIDSTLDRRTAYAFLVTASGVQEDGLFYDDDQMTTDWDAVWDAATAIGSDGWSAEMMIPLAVLRFSDAPSQTWGFGAERVIARTHEEMLSVRISRAQSGIVSHFGMLRGLADLEPVTDLEITPYLAARVGLRPQHSPTWMPQPRLFEPNADFGADVKASLGRGLALQATLNPDFGQVEADQIIQNLTRFEVVFPEKRPFFLEGMDLFQPVPGGSGNRESPQRMFYSRRIGLDAPIFGAAKLIGQANDTLQVGLLESVVTGAGWPGGTNEFSPPGGTRLEATQPLHLAPTSAYPELEPATRNFFAGVARWKPAPTSSFGLWATSALLAGPSCTPAEADLPHDPTDVASVPRPPEGMRPKQCEALAGNAVAGDWSLRTPDSEWFFRGQATGSQWLGRAPVRVLPDGTALRNGDLGWGAFAAAGRQGGEPWRFEAQWQYESPKLELDAMGYQRTQNEQVGRAILHWTRPNGVGPFNLVDLQTGYETHWTTDGRGFDRGDQVWIGTDFDLRSYQSFGCFGVLNFHSWDVREIDRSGVYGAWDDSLRGVAYRRPGGLEGHCWFVTDPQRALQVGGNVDFGRTLALDGLAPVTWWAGGLTAVWRPHSRAETRLELKYEENRWRARWVDDLGGAPYAYLFADLRAPDASVILRQQLVVTPQLTLQAYAQLFAAYGHYGPFYAASPTGGAIRASALTPHPYEAGYDFRDVALNVNLVLRWEYRLGSTLFLVYTRAQSELGFEDGSAPSTLRPHALANGPTTETYMIKWSYWWSA